MSFHQLVNLAKYMPSFFALFTYNFFLTFPILYIESPLVSYTKS